MSAVSKLQPRPSCRILAQALTASAITVASATALGGARPVTVIVHGDSGHAFIRNDDTDFVATWIRAITPN